jgi:hypothetical protein
MSPASQNKTARPLTRIPVKINTRQTDKNIKSITDSKGMRTLAKFGGKKNKLCSQPILTYILKL